jgi:hypothetical protein
MSGSEVARMQPRRRLVIRAITLAAVGTLVASLATRWALSQAAAASGTGRAAEVWILAMRPLLIPLCMLVTWLAVRRSSGTGLTRAVRILGSGVVMSVILLFLDGVVSAGF